MTLSTLNYGNFGIFLIMGNAGFMPSTIVTSYNASAQSRDPLRVAMYPDMLVRPVRYTFLSIMAVVQQHHSDKAQRPMNSLKRPRPQIYRSAQRAR